MSATTEIISYFFLIFDLKIFNFFSISFFSIKSDLFFLIILVIVVSAFIGLNIIKIVDSRMKQLSITMPSINIGQNTFEQIDTLYPGLEYSWRIKAFLNDSDLGGYLDMYKDTEFSTFTSYFQLFSVNLNEIEFLPKK